MKPVAITGMGIVSPFGYGPDALWHGVETNTILFSPIPDAEYKHSPGRYGAIPCDALPKGNALITRANDFAKLGYWAAHAALRDARYRVGDGYQCALISGSTIGYSVVNQFGDMLDMSRAQYMYHSAVNGIISVEDRIRGMQIMLCSQESVSTQGIGLASQLIASGKYQAALAGGVEIYSRALHACYSTTRKVSPLDADELRAEDPAMRPWGPTRNGFVFSEGACYLLLEDLELARARGARVYGLIAGWGTSQEPAHDGYEINEGGACLSESIDQALSSAGIDANQVNTVFASANGSVRKDAVELRVLSEKFAQTPVTVTGFKHLLGEALGASGAFSVALACLNFERSGRLPAVQDGAPIRGTLKFSSGDEPVGDTILITDLGYRGDSAALLLWRN